MNQTKTILLCIGIAVLVAIGVAVKIIWFPSVKDVWFQNARQLRLAPRGLVVVRPTHFPNMQTNDIIYSGAQGGMRIAGRNVTLQQLASIAYDYNPGKVYVPPGAPKNNFDFLITIPKANDRLKKIITNRLGYTAHVETRDADVLALKVEDPNLPGLVTSGPNERQNANVKKGRMYLTHMKLQDVTSGLEYVLKTPVVDETGMSNYYDFSLAWTPRVSSGKLNREDIDKIIGEWGLKFEPDTESMEMLVLKKTY
ncbi:MAG TPA: TIGR03435 family protein [Candidatus Acidoferrum sp.]|nr:TIGR03435 family protein [Candidatus Acidoferrum sp.]